MILIIQNGFIQTLIQKYLDEEIEVIKAYEYMGELNQLDLSKYSLVIVLGGHQSLTSVDSNSDTEKVIDFIRFCYQKEKPLLGICLGCQMIGRAMGCDIKRMSYGRIDYTTHLVIHEYTYDSIFRCHNDYIIPNDNIKVICSFQEMPYLIQAGSLLGVQCHPDIPPEYLASCTSLCYYRYTSKYSDEEINTKNKILMTKLIEMTRNFRN